MRAVPSARARPRRRAVAASRNELVAERARGIDQDLRVVRERRRRAQLRITVRRRRLAGEQLEGALVVDEKLVGPQRPAGAPRPDGREEQRPRERRGNSDLLFWAWVRNEAADAVNGSPALSRAPRLVPVARLLRVR